MRERKEKNVITKLWKLTSVNSLIASSLDKTQVIKSILEQTKLLMECEKSSVLLVDPLSETIFFEIVSNEEDMQSLKSIRLRKGEGVAGQAWEKNEIIVINNAVADRRVSKKADQKLEATTYNLIAAPLTVRAKTIGVMEAINKLNNKPFSQLDRQVFQTLAHQAAIAIENAILYEMAIRDSMTKLFIHGYFYERLEEEYRRALRNGHFLAVVMFDIDHFKQFNDSYGHRLGDEVLVRTAEIIRKNCRSFDIPARYGGEEFALLLPETNEEGALRLAERIRQLVADQKIWYEERCLQLTISGGVAVLGVKGRGESDPTTLIEQADRALYYSKQAGRNRVSLYCHQMSRLAYAT